MLHQEALSSASAASVLDTRSVTADIHPSASHVADLNCLVNARPQRDSLSAVAVGMTTRQTTGAV
jgi:hypothetical protein